MYIIRYCRGAVGTHAIDGFGVVSYNFGAMENYCDSAGELRGALHGPATAPYAPACEALARDRADWIADALADMRAGRHGRAWRRYVWHVDRAARGIARARRVWYALACVRYGLNADQAGRMLRAARLELRLAILRELSR